MSHDQISSATVLHRDAINSLGRWGEVRCMPCLGLLGIAHRTAAGSAQPTQTLPGMQRTCQAHLPKQLMV